MAKKAGSKKIDFSKVKERGAFNPAHRPEGDYLGRVIKVEDSETQGGKPQWVFTIKQGAATYPYRCQFEENVLWKIRNLFVACGFSVGKSRIDVDPNRCIGKDVGMTLTDHEYEGKVTSEIASVFPPSELNPDDIGPGEDEDDEPAADEDDEETETVAKPAKAKKDKKKKAKVSSVDVDEL